MVTAGEHLTRLTKAGKPDRTFGDEGDIYLPPTFADIRVASDIALDQRGRTLVARTIYKDDYSDGTLMRVNPGGSIDRNFGKFGVVGLDQFGLNKENHMSSVGLGRSGEIFVAGNKEPYSPPFEYGVMAKVNESGIPVRRFGRKGSVKVRNPRAKQERRFLVEVADVEPMPDGGVIAAAYVGKRVRIFRVNQRGRKIRNFGGGEGAISVRSEGLPYLPTTTGFPYLSATGGLSSSFNRARFYFLHRDMSGRSSVVAFSPRGKLVKGFGRNGTSRFGGPDSFRAVAIAPLPRGMVAVGGTVTPRNSDRNVGALLILDRDGDRVRSIGRNGIKIFPRKIGIVTDLATNARTIQVGGNNEFGDTGQGRYESVVASLRLEP
jgi:hypothetical protein